MSLDDTLEEHRIAGLSLRNGMHTAMRARVRLVRRHLPTSGVARLDAGFMKMACGGTTLPNC